VFYHWKKQKGGCRVGEQCEYSHAPMTAEQEKQLLKEQEEFEKKKTPTINV
jgi:hypothetical protein